MSNDEIIYVVTRELKHQYKSIRSDSFATLEFNNLEDARKSVMSLSSQDKFHIYVIKNDYGFYEDWADGHSTKTVG